MGLTGHRLDGAEMFACGIASHFVPTEVSSFASLQWKCFLSTKLTQNDISFSLSVSSQSKNSQFQT